MGPHMSEGPSTPAPSAVPGRDCLTELTIVVFTRSRPDYARRQANYWSEKAATLWVFDNGECPWPEYSRESLGSNVHYEHDPGGFYRQILRSAEVVSTKYAVLVDDDNMLIERGLRSCIAHLDKAPEVVAVMGQAAGLAYSRGHVVISPAYRANFDYSNDSVNAVDRVRCQLAPYRCTGWYAVQRRPVFQRLIPLIAEVAAASPCAYASEIALEVGLVVLGPTSTARELTILRSAENAPESDANHSRELSFSQWWLDPQHTDETEAFLSAMSRHLGLDSVDSLTLAEELSRFARADSTPKRKLARILASPAVKLVTSRLSPHLRSRIARMPSRARLVLHVTLGRARRLGSTPSYVVVGVESADGADPFFEILRPSTDLSNTLAFVRSFHCNRSSETG